MKHTKTLLCAVIAAVMSVFLTACGSGGSGGKKESLKMIDLTGMSKADAETWINDNNIDRSQVFYNYSYSETVAEGKIISQSIPAGEEIGDQKLTIDVSNGIDPDAEITLIDFTGMSLDEIQKWFINEHFQHVSVEYDFDPNVPVGQFLGTNVTDGKALRSDPIVIRISGDPEQAGVAVTMPDMTGWTKAQAEQWGNENHITVDYTITLDPNVPYGDVISFYPPAGTEIIKGDRIQVVYSGGSQVDAVDLTGRSKEDIEAWSESNGVQLSWIQCWNAAPADTVYANSPNSGKMNVGDIMTVYISVGPIPVRDYTGKQYQANFMGWLNSINSQYNGSANLKVAVSEQETSDTDSGVILSQSPSSGYINPYDTITLVVSKYVDPQPTPTPEQQVYVPSMTGYSESDFLNALSSLGVNPGKRVEQYSSYLGQNYIISNRSGTVDIGSSIDYIVSLGQFKIIPQYWAYKDISDLQSFIDSANRMGANVYLNINYTDTQDADSHNRIRQISGPADDGRIDVTVMRLRVYSTGFSASRSN